MAELLTRCQQTVFRDQMDHPVSLLLFSEEHYASCNECLTAVRYGLREALMVVELELCLMFDAGNC